MRKRKGEERSGVRHTIPESAGRVWQEVADGIGHGERAEHDAGAADKNAVGRNRVDIQHGGRDSAAVFPGQDFGIPVRGKGQSRIDNPAQLAEAKKEEIKEKSL